MLKAVERRKGELGKKVDPVPGQAVPQDYPFANDPPFSVKVGPQPDGMPLHACMGLNSCAASDRFGYVLGGTPNKCAGQGYCSTAVDHTCHVQNSCRGQGGCGLYGTAEDMNNPGANACKSLGSCATPINAERFSANGDNKGQSVWARARKVFEQNWPKIRQDLLAKRARGEIPQTQPLPATLGSVPKSFTGIGPSYLWISANDTERGNMTACGASGLSGAGGCS